MPLNTFTHTLSLPSTPWRVFEIVGEELGTSFLLRTCPLSHVSPPFHLPQVFEIIQEEREERAIRKAEMEAQKVGGQPGLGCKSGAHLAKF